MNVNHLEVIGYREDQLKKIFDSSETLSIDLMLNSGNHEIDQENRIISNDAYWKGFFPVGHVLNFFSSNFHAGFKKRFFKEEDRYAGITSDTDGFIVRYKWKQLSGPSLNVLFSLDNPMTYINDLVPGEYEFELKVTDNRGDTAIDKIKVIVTGPPNFVPDQNLIKIYPNPVVDIATLDVKSIKVNTLLTVHLYDLQGKMVFNKELVANQFNIVDKIDLRNLLKGAYILTVYFDNTEKKTLKIIKQ